MMLISCNAGPSIRAEYEALFGSRSIRRYAQLVSRLP